MSPARNWLRVQVGFVFMNQLQWPVTNDINST